MSDFLKLAAGAGIEFHVAFSVVHSSADGGVHHAVVAGEEVEGGAEVFAQPGAVGEWVGENSPDEGYEGAASYTGEAVRGEFVDWIIRLSVGRCGFNTNFPDLKLVPND